MKSYNGVAILSRKKPEAVFFGFDDGGDPEDSRLLRVLIDGIPIVNTYVPQGFEIDSPKYAYKLAWYERLRNYFNAHLSPHAPAIWCGDMNVAPRPMDVHSPEKHLNHVCYHEAARNAYDKTVAWGFQDVFVKLYPTRQQYTFWDYRAPSSLGANKGWRIDHMMATAPLAEKCMKADVDVEPAASERAFRPHLFVGRVFDLTAHATPKSDSAIGFTASGPSKVRLLGSLGSHLVAAIQLNQGINDQAAIETTENDRTG